MLYTHRIAACSAASQCRPLAQCSIVYQHFNPEVILLNRAANDPSVFTITVSRHEIGTSTYFPI